MFDDIGIPIMHVLILGKILIRVRRVTGGEEGGLVGVGVGVGVGVVEGRLGEFRGRGVRVRGGCICGFFGIGTGSIRVMILLGILGFMCVS